MKLEKPKRSHYRLKQPHLMAIASAVNALADALEASQSKARTLRAKVIPLPNTQESLLVFCIGNRQSFHVFSEAELKETGLNFDVPHGGQSNTTWREIWDQSP